MGPTPKCHFVLGLLSASLEIPKVGIRLLSIIVQRYVAHHLHVRKLRRFLTISGWESNWQFDSQPFFWA
jgi:hypothetical protein